MLRVAGLPPALHLGIELLADPTLPDPEIANDHPERCRIDRIAFESVREAVDRLLLAPVEAQKTNQRVPG